MNETSTPSPLATAFDALGSLSQHAAWQTPNHPGLQSSLLTGERPPSRVATTPPLAHEPQGPPTQGARRGGPASAAVAASAARGVDWGLVVQLRRLAADEISENLSHWAREHGTSMSDDDRRLMGRSVIRARVRDHAEQLNRTGQALWSLALERAYATAVENAIFGYGRLQPLFDIPDAENIEIHGWDSVFVQYGDGHREEQAPVADSDEELIEAIRFLGDTANPPRPFDDAHPMMTVALGERFRLHAIGFGLADRPSIIIRQHLLTSVTLEELAAGGMMPGEVASFLRRCVLARKSIVISGDHRPAREQLLSAGGSEDSIRATSLVSPRSG